MQAGGSQRAAAFTLDATRAAARSAPGRPALAPPLLIGFAPEAASAVAARLGLSGPLERIDTPAAIATRSLAARLVLAPLFGTRVCILDLARRLEGSGARLRAVALALADRALVEAELAAAAPALDLAVIEIGAPARPRLRLA